MNKWFKNILAAALIIGLLWYLVAQRHQLEEAWSKLTAWQLLALYPLLIAQVFCSASVARILLGALKTKTSLWDMFLLQNAAILLNYLPMRFGTLFRASYLKRHYGLSYAHFGTFFICLILLMTTGAAAVGLVALVAVYGIDDFERKILALAFLGSVVCSVCLICLPLPIPSGTGKLSTALRRFLTGRAQVIHNKAALGGSVVFVSANFVLTCVGLWIIYSGMGVTVHPAGFLVLGAITLAVFFVSLTPGALGIKEVILGAGAVVLGVPLEIGILAAMIHRAVGLSFAFTLGGICSIYLWRKSPEDFRKSETEGSSEDATRAD